MSGKSHPLVDRFNRHLRKENSKSKKGQIAAPEDRDMEQNERAGEEPEMMRYEPEKNWTALGHKPHGGLFLPALPRARFASFTKDLCMVLWQQLLIFGPAESQIVRDRPVPSA
jgi:hypothetical protein